MTYRDLMDKLSYLLEYSESDETAIAECKKAVLEFTEDPNTTTTDLITLAANLNTLG